MSDHKRQTAAGRPGTSVRVGDEWVGWTELVADPRAPAGAGGPGNFSPPMPLTVNEESDLPSPWRPGPSGVEPLDTLANPPTPANPPPVTHPGSLGVIKVEQNNFVDYRIDAAIVADGSGGAATVTGFTKPDAVAPMYDTKDGKITKFKGKFTFKGTIKIQTTYAAGSSADGLSCYGRGTTDTDVRNRDITLGFHESCHRDDYQAYLKVNALPEPPAMSLGMNSGDYDNAVLAFVAERKEYWTDMSANSVTNTDEVGFTRSTANTTHGCFVHKLP
jgi:hypothetical protein